MVKLTCHKCKNEWDYTGKHKDNPKAKATCPACKTLVLVGEHKSKE